MRHTKRSLMKDSGSKIWNTIGRTNAEEMQYIALSKTSSMNFRGDIPTNFLAKYILTQKDISSITIKDITLQ